MLDKLEMWCVELQTKNRKEPNSVCNCILNSALFILAIVQMNEVYQDSIFAGFL